MTRKNDNFFERVYEVVRQIPEGRVTNYGAVARYIGSPQSSRMVGWALNSCHSADSFVPAHRVLNKNGCLTGKMHFRHPDLMQELLEAEGLEVFNDQVENFNLLFWDPSIELKSARS